MSNPPIRLLFCRRDDVHSSCIDYVLSVFARAAGWAVDVAGGDAVPAGDASRVVRIVYDDAVPSGAAPAFAATLLIQRGAFFGPAFLRSPDLPAAPPDLIAAAAKKEFPRFVSRPDARTAVISVDLVAAAFWFLTRYEEYLISTPDEHGRFLCAHSIAPPEMYDKPLVNMWFERLRELIVELVTGTPPPVPIPGPQTFCLTHDIDVMRKYRGFRGLQRALTSMMQKGVSGARVETRNASMVLAGVRRDPYDSFEDLFALKEKLSAQSTFFFIAAKRHRLDGDYTLEDPHVRELMSRIRAFHDEIAVHSSYDSWRSDAMIREECETLARVAGRFVEGTRQHYLRFTVPETWRALCAAGVRYDSSAGFADRAGFRCGWSGCFHPFDVENRAQLPIIEIPLVAMDMSLAVYEKLSGEHSLERLSRLLDASAVRGGAFVLLWHNTLRDAAAYPGFWDSFEYFVFAAAGSARYITLSRLCDEFENSDPAARR